MPALSEGRGGSGFGMRHSANETDHTVGRRLRTLRLARGLSQSEFGTHLGVTYQQIQKYEAGTNRIAASRLFRAAALFGVDPADLLRTSSGLPPTHSWRLSAAPRRSNSIGRSSEFQTVEHALGSSNS